MARRWQIPRPDLNRVFDFKHKYLDNGYHCVVFQLRSEPGVFEMDGGAAGGRSVVNAQRKRFEDADITAPCHEWLHILHSAIWEQGGFSWSQCLPLHDQVRDMQLRTAWKTGRFPLQKEIFVDSMRRYTTHKMWASVGNLKLDELPDAEDN